MSSAYKKQKLSKRALIKSSFLGHNMYFLNKSVQKKSLFTLGLVALSLLIAPTSAQAATIGSLQSQDATAGFDDDDFRSLIQNNKFSEIFVAEGRIGNNGTGGNGERELGINDKIVYNATTNNFGGGSPDKFDNLTWGNGKVWDFSLEYKNQQVTYKLFDSSNPNSTVYNLVTQKFTGDATDMYIRTFAQRDTINVQNSANSNTKNKITLSNLALGGQNFGTLSSQGGSAKDVDYLHIKDISGSFTLTGKTSMSWVGKTPTNSNLAFQLKVGNSPRKKVPEPGTVGAIFLTGVIGAGLRKRQQATQEV
jgi:hypothetical protein